MACSSISHSPAHSDTRRDDQRRNRGARRVGNNEYLMRPRRQFTIDANGGCGVALTHPIEGMPWRRSPVKSYEIELSREEQTLLFSEIRRIKAEHPEEPCRAINYGATHPRRPTRSRATELRTRPVTRSASRWAESGGSTTRCAKTQRPCWTPRCIERSRAQPRLMRSGNICLRTKARRRRRTFSTTGGQYSTYASSG
jgi:hypothetical protein